jgi:putative ABC transport system permease protein
MLAVYFGVNPRPAFTIASLLVLWYWLLPLPFSLFIDDASDYSDPLFRIAELLGFAPDDEVVGNIEMFFVSGIALTAAATLFVIFNSDLLLGVLNLLSRVMGGIAPAARMAISYPLASKTRTGMTLAMFTLVVFSLVVMATLNSNFTQLFLGEDAKGGFDVRVSANESNRIPDLREALLEAGYDVDANISGVGTLLTDDPQVKAANSSEDFETYLVQGVNEEFVRLADFPLTTRAAGYDSDEAVFQALLNDPTLAIVDESRAAPEDPFEPDDSDFHLGPTADELRSAPWDPIPVIVRDPETGREIELKVIGVLEPQVTSVTFAWLALFTHRSVVENELGGGETESFFLTTRDQSKDAAVEVASSIEAALLERGVLATSFQQEIDDAAAQSNAFQYLFEGFMGLGLIVGIAALGVIAFRTVAERRQQIGMLRAIGYTRKLIGLAFFMESSFIALAGIAMGMILGSALSYNLLTSPELLGETGAEVEFRFPLARLLIIVAIAYGASALMTLIPARSASKMPVAEALRYAG